MIQQQRNLDQLTQARQSQMFANCKRDPTTPAFDDISIFLPHPAQWLLQTEERKLDISRETAIEFLQSYKSFDAEVEVVFDDWLREIQLIATL